MSELLGINVEVGWNCKFNCEDCYRYFECPQEQKYEIYNRGRMDKVKAKMEGIKHKIAVLSGKGGVGKSTVTANLAISLAYKKKFVSVIDSDFSGPCIPKIFGLGDGRLKIGRQGIIPVIGPLGIKVISMAFLLQEDEPLTWFHHLKRGALEEFLAHVDYGQLDYLLLDLPPGTGPESLNVMKYLPTLDGVVVVTIPSEISQGVARRGITICKKAKVPIIGIIENMSGFVCSHCGRFGYPLRSGGGERLAQETGVGFLGRIPLDERIAKSSDEGVPFPLKYPDSEITRSFIKVVERIEERVEKGLG